MSPRKRQPAPTDHATMLDLALEDLQRATEQGRDLLKQHPDRAHAAFDLLLFNVGCWEVRWLNVATEGAPPVEVLPLVDENGISTLELGETLAMSERARELVESPDDEGQGAGRRSRSRSLTGQVGHGRAAV